MLDIIFKPFNKEISWRGLLGRFGITFILGIAAMTTIQSFAHYNFEEADILSDESGECIPLEMSLLLIMPLIEEPLARILPHKYLGNKAAFVGSMIWALLHIIGRNWAIVAFQFIMAIFYYKLVSSGRYKETLIFHEGFNLIPLSTCFL